jgi:hypothetical protein
MEVRNDRDCGFTKVPEPFLTQERPIWFMRPASHSNAQDFPLYHSESTAFDCFPIALPTTFTQTRLI